MHNLDLKTYHSDATIIEYTDRIIIDAISKQVSDIHIEPYEYNCRIRFRQNGLLYTATTIAIPFANQLCTRLKVMANLNIAEKRLPQDGRIQIKSHNKVDIRVNTCPILYGEKMVLRILHTKQSNLSIYSLGMMAEQSEQFADMLAQPQGLILVTGPTGSGKSITLYSALEHLNKNNINISTVEDPVEIELAGVNQININTKIGLDFATTLRALLRQDPDILMIGEIRDIETATIALQAAQTGHLVLSTLHSNSAAETMARFKSMGIATHLLVDINSFIISQRLIRTLCQACKTNIHTPNHSGCHHCQNGYTDRTGIFEILPLTSSNAIHQLSLRDAGLKKAREGVTSYDELYRVLGK